MKGDIIDMIMKKKKTLVKTPVKTPTPKVVTSPSDTPEETQRLVRPEVFEHKGDSMRDLFFIVKGQYRKGVEPSFLNSVTGEVFYTGGFNPERPDTEQWYMCLDKVTFHCVSCGSNLNKVVKSVYNMIIEYKGSAKKYFKHISDITSDDYYETHYLGHAPLTTEQINKKAEGRCPRTSPAMRCLYDEVFRCYGDHYLDLVQEMEDKAYSDLEEVIRESRPINRTRKIMKKTPMKKVKLETPVTPPTPQEGVNTKLKKLGKTKRGVRKLAMK